MYVRTSEIGDVYPCLRVLCELGHDLECPNPALEVVCLQQVNQEVHPAHIPDCQLAGILLEVKVQQGAQRNNGGCLVASLEG